MTSSMTTTKTESTQERQRPATKTHGGKFYLARSHIALFPQGFTTYGELCVGGGSVFENLRESSYQRAILNDLHYPTYALWRCLQDPDLFDRFHDTLRGIPYSEEAFVHERTREPDGWDLADIAVQHYCVNRMSRGGMGKTFAWSQRLRGGQPGDLNAWRTALANLPDQHERLQTIDLTITNQHILTCLLELAADPEAFLYIDPPYLTSTRTAKEVYACEMDYPTHEVLLAMLRAARAKVILCGYHSELYDTVLSDWRLVEFRMANHAGQGKKKQKRTECVWMNYQ